MSVLQPHLLTQLASLHELVVEFKLNLEHESRALAQWPPTALPVVQAEKIRLVRDLEVAHDELSKLMGAQGQDMQGMKTQSAEVAKRWQGVRDELALCHRLNATNERCLARQQLALKQSLELLMLKLDQDMTYGRQGSCQGGRRLSHIGLA